MRALAEKPVGTFLAGRGVDALEYEIIVRPRITPMTAEVQTTIHSQAIPRRKKPLAGTALNGRDCQFPLNLTLDTGTKEQLNQICRKLRMPRYLGLETVLRAIADDESERPFVRFCEAGEYVEPRKIGGQQSHFNLSASSNALLEKLSWECAEGNKSRLARLAVAYALQKGVLTRNSHQEEKRDAR